MIRLSACSVWLTGANETVLRDPCRGLSSRWMDGLAIELLISMEGTGTWTGTGTRGGLLILEAGPTVVPAMSLPSSSS